MSWLAANCPRLAKARDEYLAERERAWQTERRRLSQQLQLERLVAHRELQYLRVAATGDRRRVAERARKLAAAERDLERVRRRGRRAA